MNDFIENCPECNNPYQNARKKIKILSMECRHTKCWVCLFTSSSSCIQCSNGSSKKITKHFRCPVCKQLFNKKFNFNRHIKRKHETAKTPTTPEPNAVTHASNSSTAPDQIEIAHSSNSSPVLEPIAIVQSSDSSPAPEPHAHSSKSLPVPIPQSIKEQLAPEATIVQENSEAALCIALPDTSEIIPQIFDGDSYDGSLSDDDLSKIPHSPLSKCLATFFPNPPGTSTLEQQNNATNNSNISVPTTTTSQMVTTNETVADVERCENLFELDENGNTIIHRICANPSNSRYMFDRVIDIVLVQKDAGHVFAVKNKKGQTPLHIKLELGVQISACAVKRIFHVSAMDMDSQDNEGKSFLELATTNGKSQHWAVVRELFYLKVKAPVTKLGIRIVLWLTQVFSALRQLSFI